MAAESIKAAAAVSQAHHGITVPRRPSDAGRLLKSGFDAIRNREPLKVKVEVLVDGGTREVTDSSPIPVGVLKAFNRFGALPADDDNDDDHDDAAAAEVEEEE